MSSRRRKLNRKVVGNTALAALGAATIVGVLSLVLVPTETAPVSSQVTSYYEANKELKFETKAPTLTNAELLARVDAPLTISVLGDSTGDQPTEWVALTGAWIGQTYNRTVTMATFDNAVKAYAPAVTLHEGAGKPVTIYNGSIPGTRSDEADPQLKQMVPGPAEMLWINYGHNHGPDAWPAIQKTTLAATDITKTRVKNVMVIGQNPAVGDALHEKKVKGILAGAAVQGYVGVDVFKAFTDSPNMDDLYLDVRHPSPAGSEVWTKAVQAVLAAS
jgi:hypothetical protein